jgi:hypothetical protein
MNIRSSSTRPLSRALAAAMTLALGACAGTGGGGIEQKPDKPFKTANVCSDSAIPDGWIRTNDWRGKGCGIAESDTPAAMAASAQEGRAGIELASASLPPRAKAKPPADLSRGVNAVAESGPNNWMTIAELDRVRIGRSLTACAGAVPEGWVEKSRYWDKGRCGNPARQAEKNVMLIERVK